jgi:hypothetical protein
MNFKNWKNSNDVNKATMAFAHKRDLEVLVYNQTDDLGRVENTFIEIWPLDDNAEMPFVTYLIKEQGSLQLWQKHTDCNKQYGKGNIEDLLYIINDDKELRLVIDHIHKA